MRRHYVGRLWACPDCVCLSGRDSVSGIEVTLSIPIEELAHVRVGHSPDELLAGERSVVLELAESEEILLREVGVGPLHVHVLARRLAALTRGAPAPHAVSAAS